jgi:hypothetical protein
MGFGKEKEELTAKKGKFKIDLETAENEFDNWAESWEIDTDIENFDDEEKTDFKTQKNKIIKAFRYGRLRFNEEDETLIYNCIDIEKEVIIKRPKGRSLMQMDKYKDRESVHKTYAVLGAMTGKLPKFFSEMDGIDLKPFMAVVTLFLAS